MKIKFLVLPAIFTGVSLIGQTFSAEAQLAFVPTCTLSTLNSSYGAQATGTLVSPPAPFTSGIFGETGLVSFSGDGKFGGNDTVSFNGTIITRTFRGNYTVQPDCTASFTFTDNFGNSATANGVIVNNGKKVIVIQTVPTGTVITGSFEKL